MIPEIREFVRLCKSEGCTDVGIAWLNQLVDPFHLASGAEGSIPECVGVPDLTSDRSIISTVVLSQTISVPSPAAGRNWDCHIATQPAVCNSAYSGIPVFLGSQNPPVPSTEQGRWFLHLPGQQGTGPNMQDLVTICTVESGFNTYDYSRVVVLTGSAYSVPTNPGDVTYQGLSVPQLNQPNRSRLVSLAYKVVNDTAPINAQGHVITYRVQNKVVNSAVTYGNANFSAFPSTQSPIDTTVSQATYSSPPIQAFNARQLNSVNGKAVDGALAVAQMNSDALSADCGYPDIGAVAMMSPLGIEAPELGIIPAIGRSPGDADAFSSMVGTLTDNVPAPIQSYRTTMFDQSGSYFTGLSPETVLTLTVYATVETFPNNLAPSYAQARPSPIYDPAALRLAAILQRGMSPGYPADYNDAGDLFRSVVGVIKDGLANLPAIKRVFRTVGNVADAASTFLPGPLGFAAKAIKIGTDGGIELMRQLQRARLPNTKEGRRALNVALTAEKEARAANNRNGRGRAITRGRGRRRR